MQHKKGLRAIPKCPQHPRDFHEAAEELKTVEARDWQCAEQLNDSTETTADTSGALSALQMAKGGRRPLLRR